MQIERLVELTKGSLNETCKVAEIYSATVHMAKVGEGSLYISSSQEDIDEAITHGAEAIIYDDETIKINDASLAWILVEDLQAAAFAITQEVIAEDEANFYYFNEHELAFLKMILLRKSDIEFLKGDWKRVFETVLNSKRKIFIGTDLEMMRVLRPKARKLVKEVDGYVISDTLFRSTFKVQKYVYQHKELVPFHLDHILKVVAFCQEHGFDYRIEDIRYIPKFTPLFIDGEPAINEQSKNDRTVIVCDNLEDIQEARLYILAPSAWVVKSIVLTPPKTKVDGVKYPIYYHDSADIIETLQQSNFNYAFVYSKDAQIKEIIKKEYDLY